MRVTEDSIHWARANGCIAVLATPPKLYNDSYFYFMLLKDLRNLLEKKGAAFCCVAY